MGYKSTNVLILINCIKKIVLIYHAALLVHSLKLFAFFSQMLYFSYFQPAIYLVKRSLELNSFITAVNKIILRNYLFKYSRKQIVVIKT